MGSITKAAATILLAAATFHLPAAAQAQSGECKGEGRLQHICGLNNAEDMIAVEGAPWVLTGNMGDKSWQGGGFYLVSTRDRSVRAVKPDFSRPKEALYRECPGAPDPEKFNVQGVSLRNEGAGKHTIYTTNNGGRRSIEVYELDVSSAPRITWKGCVIAPPPLSLNSVTHLPGDALAVTVFANAEDPTARPRAFEGLPSGFVLEWSPNAGWSTIPGSEFSGNNGIVASADGKWLYVAGYAGLSVHKLSRGRVPYQRQAVRVGFLADNIRWTPDGKLLVGGHAAPLADVSLGCNGTDLVVCPVATGVALVDPATMKAQTLLIEAPTRSFGAGTVAIVVADELWIGSLRSQRIATIKLKEVQP